MIKHFTNNQPFIVILIPIFVLLHMLLDYYFPFFNQLSVEQENLWNLDFQMLNDFWSKTLAFVFICVNALLLNYVFNTLEFYSKNTYIPSVFYVLLVFLFPISLRFSEDLLAHFFFILSFYKLLSIRQNDDARNNSFLSGLFLGAAVTFLPIYATFLLVIWFGLFIIRPFVLREYTLPIIAMAFSLMWVVLVNPSFIEDVFRFHSDLDFERFDNFVLFLPHIVIIILTLLGYKKILERRPKSSIRYKRIMSITVFTLLFSACLGVVMLVLNDTYFFFTIGITILPFILPYAYLEVKYKWLPYSLFYVFILLNIIKFFY